MNLSSNGHTAKRGKCPVSTGFSWIGLCALVLIGCPRVWLQDSQLVVEAYKSGFEPPGDIEFEDYTQPMKRTVSENSLSSSKEGKSELRFGGKSRGKLWPFIKKNKVLAVRTLSGLRQQGAEARSLSFGLNPTKLSPSRKREGTVSVLRSFDDANDLFLVVVSLPWPLSYYRCVVTWMGQPH